jgi:hypothetical protein
MSLVGLSWHRLAKHNVRPNKTTVVLASNLPAHLNAQAYTHSETIPVVQKSVEKPQEAKAVMEQETKEQIPQESLSEIIRRELTTINLERDSKLELEQLRKENAALQEQINTNSDRPVEIPDLSTVIQHCESGECVSHAKQWDGIKARIIQGAYDNLPPEAIPDKVVEAEGLRRGFIPKKIIIPGRFV